MPKGFHPNFMATGIGSLPHLDPKLATYDVLSRLDQMPYWPQLPHRHALEDMNLMFASALHPLLAGDEAKRSLEPFAGGSREDSLALYYERLFSADPDQFKLSPGEARVCLSFWTRSRTPGMSGSPGSRAM